MVDSTWVQLEDQQQSWHRTASKKLRFLSIQSLVSENKFYTFNSELFDYFRKNVNVNVNLKFI